MITPLPGITATKPGSAFFLGSRACLPSARRVGRRSRSTKDRASRAEPRAVDGWGASPLQEPTDRRDLFKRFVNETLLVGDASRRDADGYLWWIRSIDDVVNGSRPIGSSTAEVESSIVAPPRLAEAAVDWQHYEQSGARRIVAFL